MDLDFNPWSLFAAFIFGVIGIYAFRLGKRNVDFRMVFVGIALMVYPYFVSGAALMWGVGAGLCGLGYYLNNY